MYRLGNREGEGKTAMKLKIVSPSDTKPLGVDTRGRDGDHPKKGKEQ